jgi:hypothetical protein
MEMGILWEDGCKSSSTSVSNHSCQAFLFYNFCFSH